VYTASYKGSQREKMQVAKDSGVTCVHVPVTVHRSRQCRISYV